ncbi:MAG: 5-formyltetrahydrofolate cyclo-ligase [Desulfuromonadaceae bacterium GWC2_58_13]|nr:MAG: 5-formyltetrahydrofolate cyclo-ligase [Desulfuromonadaceae bacterium GWC2_58_13]
MPKKSIRSAMLAQRRHLAAVTCAALSHAAQVRLLETPEFSRAAILALYSPILNEVFTEELFHAARRIGKRVVYPRVYDESLEFVEVTGLEELKPGVFGVLEPSGTSVLPASVLDLILVPGISFDQAGFRLGYGKGYYDRFLHTADRCPCLVGFCFDFQLVADLPMEAHDIGMNMLVTESRTLRFFTTPELCPE